MQNRNLLPALRQCLLGPTHAELLERLAEQQRQIDATDLAVLGELDPPALDQAPPYLDEPALKVDIAH
ncbi:MAG TPA: hypothetical protein VLB12_03415 [Gemmatimonadales bacterium]|nr:hypothetical protein [Gemmatimonadales bacterium]